MTIREIAAKTNMSTDTLRYYERIGLLPPVPRNAAGIRNYDEYFVNFINFIKKLKASKQKVFTGPLYDQSGAEKVPAGTTLTDKELLSMDWFVKGVDGKIQN